MTIFELGLGGGMLLEIMALFATLVDFSCAFCFRMTFLGVV